MSGLRLIDLTKRYGDAVAVDSMSLDIPEGEMVVLLGPSGCGKTTTLRMVAGFVAATAGDILLDGKSILPLPAHRRDMGIVFQSYALFPHMTVAGNVAFGLEMRRMPKAATAARVADMLRLVKLDSFAHRFPRELSGGQQQRVALARALAIEPKVLLLDEPLSNLDAALRHEVGREIRLLQQSRQLTTIMVTHDQSEAMAMADRLVVMKQGRVQQVGSQEDLYERPANAFVARFIGRGNMLDGQLIDGRTLILNTGERVRLAGRYGPGAVTVMLRPERLRIGPAGASDGSTEGTVVLSTYLGATVEHVIRLGRETQVIVYAGTSGETHPLRPGTAAGLNWSLAAERVFDGAGEPIETHETTRETSHA